MSGPGLWRSALMDQVIATLRSPKARVPIVCVIGSAVLLVGLIGGGIINLEQTAVLVVAIYILSKVGMAAAAVWVLWKHSSQFQGFLAKLRARLRQP